MELSSLSLRHGDLPRSFNIKLSWIFTSKMVLGGDDTNRRCNGIQLM